MDNCFGNELTIWKLRDAWRQDRLSKSPVVSLEDVYPTLERKLRRCSTATPLAYVCSNCFSNVWLMFCKLWEARSRLCRSRVLQVNTKYSFELRIFWKRDWERGKRGRGWKIRQRLVWKLLTRSTKFTHVWPFESNLEAMKSASGKSFAPLRIQKSGGRLPAALFMVFQLDSKDAKVCKYKFL